MDDYDCDVGGAFDFGVASTPLSDLDAGGDYAVDVDDDNDYGDHDQEDDDDDDEEEEEDQDGGGNDDDYQVQERIVQPDGSVVIVMKPKRGHKDRRKYSTKQPNKSRMNRKQSGGPAIVKLTALAADAVATVVQQPRGRVHTPGAIQTGDWSAGLCGCLDYCTPNCCMVTFCPCISAAQIATRIGCHYTSVLLVFGFVMGLDLLMYVLTVSTMNQSDSYTYYSRGYYYRYSYSRRRLTVWGYIAIVLTILTCLAFVQLRSKVRERFRLPGSVVEDFCVSCFCPWCSLAQMATHVKSYKPGSCDFGPPDELPAYQS